MLSLTTIFWSETIGTSLLVLLGTGVVANVVLAKTKGNSGGWMLINFGWGLAVFTGVVVAAASGAYLNPAVLLGKMFSGDSEYVDGVAISLCSTAVYLFAQFLGAFVGAVLTYIIYKQHFDIEESQDNKLAVFATGPQIRSNGANFIAEMVATFVLVLAILSLGATPTGLGPLAVALIVIGIGASLGGTTGYAINPARDLSPRIAHAILPIKDKGSSDWGYAFIPVVATSFGGILAGIVYQLNILELF